MGRSGVVTYWTAQLVVSQVPVDRCLPSEAGGVDVDPVEAVGIEVSPGGVPLKLMRCVVSVRLPLVRRLYLR